MERHPLVLSFRATAAERLMLQAVAAQRDTSLARLLRELALAGLQQEVRVLTQADSALLSRNSTRSASSQGSPNEDANAK
jgi:hypothetical protein